MKKLCRVCLVNAPVRNRTACNKCLTKQHRVYITAALEDGKCILCLKSSRSENYQTCEGCRLAKALGAKTKRDQNKIRAIEYLGGKCVDCDLRSEYIAVYDFDHKEPHLKEHHIAKLMSNSWEVLVLELDKCELRCSNCHRIRHSVDGYDVHWRSKGRATCQS